MPYKILSVCVLMLSLAAPSQADFSLGVQFFMVSRDLDLGSFSVDSEDAQDLAVFVGFDAGNSMIYLQYHQEDSSFEQLSTGYGKDEFSIDWHWNENTSKRNFKNTSFGLFTTSYDVGPEIDADFLGLTLGGGITHFMSRSVFVNARVKLRLAFNDGNDLLPTNDPATEDQKAFLGYEAQAALGFQIGRKSSWSVQFGAKWQHIDFEGRFIDDSSTSLFGVARIFIPSGN